MIINQSQVAMSSNRTYVKKQSESFSIAKNEQKPKGSFFNLIEQMGGKPDEV